MTTIFLRNMKNPKLNNLVNGIPYQEQETPSQPIWVDAVYTDEWVFNNGKNYTIKAVGDPLEKLYTFAQICADEQKYNYYVTEMSMQGSWPLDFTLFDSDNNQIDWHCRFTSYPTWEELKVLTTLAFESYDLSYRGHAYRKYTPGHWEDGNGNWINGNWGGWTTNESGLPTEWDEEQQKWIFAGSYNAVGASDYNASLLYLADDPNDSIAVSTRNWTTTVPNV